MPGSRKISPLATPLVRRIGVSGALYALVAVLDLSSGLYAADQAVAAEYEVKAAYVFNFASFVTWPPAAFASPDSPIVVCVRGGNPIEEPLSRVTRGESVNGRPLEVRRFEHATEAKACHMVFTGLEARDVAPATSSLPLLTVGEAAEFLESGGMVRLMVSTDRKVGFEINVDATTRAGLSLNARLLKVARRVVGGTGRSK